MNESRATRYQRTRRRARGVAVATGLGLLAVVALTPAGDALAAWAERVAAFVPATLRTPASILLFVGVLVVVWEITLLIVVGLGRVRRPGARSHDEAGRLRGQALAAAIALPAALWCALAIQTGAWLGGPRWWMVTSIWLVASLIAAMQLAPLALSRWSGSQPLNRPALIERLGVLARRLRIDIESIESVPSGAVTATALVAGTGRSRRVFIASDVLRDWSDEEIAVVVAHEFGHHAHRDLWWTVILDAILVIGGLAVSAMVVRAAGVSPVALVALPLIGLAAGGTFLAATPLRHALSRWQERRADAFALQLTGGAAGFRAALKRLAASHLVEERPSRLTRWLYHRHPTVDERLTLADRFEKKNVTS